MASRENYKSIKEQATGGLDFLKKVYLKYGILLLVAIILIAGFLAYKFYSAKQFEKEDALDDFEETIPGKCENGEWIVFPDLSEKGKYPKFSENEKIKYAENKNGFVSEDGSKNFLTDKNYSLFFFMDRDVRVEGYDTGEGNYYVQKIKCVGEEANKDIQGKRRKLMNYISGNIDSIALEKSSQGSWQINTFYFVNDTDLYVEYESLGSLSEEAPYDGRLWLIRATRLERNVPEIKTLAYIREDSGDPKKNVIKVGEDIYKDNKNMTIYEYDDDSGQWALQ